MIYSLQSLPNCFVKRVASLERKQDMISSSVLHWVRDSHTKPYEDTATSKLTLFPRTLSWWLLSEPFMFQLCLPKSLTEIQDSSMFTICSFEAYNGSIFLANICLSTLLRSELPGEATRLIFFQMRPNRFFMILRKVATGICMFTLFSRSACNFRMLGIQTRLRRRFFTNAVTTFS